MDFIDLKTQYRLLKDRIDARIHAVLDRGSYIGGPEVAELEAALAASCGVRHAIVCASGTDALLMGLMAHGVGPGDEVITTPFTFIATGEAIALLGARPVFVDIRPDTWNLDETALAAAISPRTRAIMPVSLYGQCAEFDAINAIAERHGLPVIEDAAQSFGATYHGRHSCALSTMACTSFYPAKPLGCYGDGGACFTDDDTLAARLRRIRDHGQSGRYHHTEIGINGRLDTLQAAVLLEKLAVFAEEVRARQQVAEGYHARIRAHELQSTPPVILAHNTSVWAQYTVEVPERAAVQAVMQAAGVPTAVHYPRPLHLQPAFAGLGLAAGSFPVAEAAAARVLSLPMHPYLQPGDLDRVIEALAAALQECGQQQSAESSAG
ncbi:MAG TPA: aminotransferase DegT [Gammaproteobacteria bacterium]|nr:aminotransferase DegT [Gammaproteobacteria bacterium]